MTKDKRNSWESWTKTDTGFEKAFGKQKVIYKYGYFYIGENFFGTLKEALDYLKEQG